MPARATITFALSAVEDLEAIRDGYADQQVPDVGERLIREILNEVERLARFPQSGRIVPEYGLAHLREIIHPPFRIVYQINQDFVRIVRVWRCERHLQMPEQ